MLKCLMLVSGLVDGTAMANRYIATAKGLTENGADVTIAPIAVNQVHWNESYGHLYRPKHNKVKTMLAFVSYIKACDVVMLYGGKAIVALWTLFWARVFHKRVYHFGDEFPDLMLCTKKDKLAYPLYLWAVGHCDGVCTITEAISQYFYDNGAEIPNYIFPMIVDPDRFENLNQSECRDEYIAYCGAMVDRKDGISELINAFSKMVTDHPNVKLYLIGPTDEYTDYDKFINLVEKLNINEKVVFTGRVSLSEMPDLLCNARVLVLTRQNNRQAQGGFPTKLGEYLATGRPVVISRVGEIDRYLTDKKECYFADDCSAGTFAHLLDYVLNHYDVALRVGEAGKQKVYDDFNYKVQAAKLLEFMAKPKKTEVRKDCI